MSFVIRRLSRHIENKSKGTFMIIVYMLFQGYVIATCKKWIDFTDCQLSHKAFYKLKKKYDVLRVGYKVGILSRVF